MGRSRFAWLPALLLLLRTAAFADDPCPMNASRPAPENAYQVNDELWAGQPKKSYPRSAYRSVLGVGYVLCTCETGTCIRKCCPTNAVYMNFTCTPLNASVSVAEFKMFAPPGPTYWPTSLRKKPDILDIFVSNAPSNIFFKTGNFLEPTSDHSAVLLTIRGYFIKIRRISHFFIFAVAFIISFCVGFEFIHYIKNRVPKIVNANGTVDVYETDLFHIVYEELTCGYKYKLDPSVKEDDNFQVNKAGKLLEEKRKIIVAPDRFCLEQFSELNYQILAVVCDTEKKVSRKKNKFYTIGMTLSLPFLFLTLLVYALIKDLRNLHGKSLMCYVATQSVGYTSLIIVLFVDYSVEITLCFFLAYILHFSFIANFFWLNVMCFDIWWTFSGFRPLRENIKEHEAKTFIIYSIYAWGCSVLISLITFVMEKFPYLPTGVIRPEFGATRCWFNKLATLIYFYGPISTLLLINLLMFMHTAIVIVKHMRDAKVLKGSESQRNVNYEKKKFVLYLKLFIVMGVIWLAEMISWLTTSGGFDFGWYVVNIGNCLQAVLIFLIFVCKKRVLNLLNKKLCSRFQLTKTSTKTTNRTVPSKTSSNLKNKDAIEMSIESISNSTNNQLHGF